METKVEKTSQVEDRKEIRIVPIKQLANFLVNRFNGIVSAYEKTQNKVGAIFATIEYNRSITMNKTHRTATTIDGKKVKNPYSAIFASGKISVQFNSIWENKVTNQVKRKDGVKTDWKPDEKRANNIVNYLNSRVVCHKIKDGIETFYLNYSPIAYIGEIVYKDENGNILNYSDIKGYMKKKSEASKKKEADKHGLKVEDDVQIRQMKIENITNVSIFGQHFQVSKEEVETPVTSS